MTQLMTIDYNGFPIMRNPITSFGLNFEPVFSELLRGFDAQFQTEEDDKQFRLLLPLPGYKPTEIDVSVHKGLLQIKAENKKRGRTYKAVNLWDGVDEENVEANVEDGMLTVKLKKLEKEKPKKVEVKVS